LNPFQGLYEKSPSGDHMCPLAALKCRRCD
jgi:hypothetical protein